MEEYQVKCNGISVGSVKIDEIGIYCTVRCFCKNVGRIVRLVDKREEGDYSIGICVPLRDGIGIERRIPTKYMKGLQHHFVLISGDEDENEVYPFGCGLSAEILRRIEQCRYVVHDQQPGIVILNR